MERENESKGCIVHKSGHSMDAGSTVGDVSQSEGSSLKCATNSVVKSCVFKISKSDSRADEVMIYDTKEYMNKICMPRNSAYFNLVSHAMEINVIQ